MTPKQPKGLKAPKGGKADDLKEITGVGPKLEKQLNDLGIFHFAQVRDLKKGEVAWVEDHIGYPDRMERDEWQKQAKALASAKAKGGKA